MSGRGAGIGLGIILPIQRLILKALLRATTGCSGAVAGARLPGTAESPLGSTTPLRFGTTSSGSGSPANSEAYTGACEQGGQAGGYGRGEVRATCKRARGAGARRSMMRQIKD